MTIRPTISQLHTSDPDRRSEQAGQILPLVALFIIVLFGMAALAVDVSRAYADLRAYRSAADAASLAGAQDLQVPNTRTVGSAQYTSARTRALTTLRAQLGGTGTGVVGTGNCNPSSNIVNCGLTGTPYVVNVKTNPSPTCSACDPTRAVQVTVANPNYGLTFARVLGSNAWDVGVTSVAGLDFGKAYTIITLRPPKRSGSTFIINDIDIDGGSVVNVDFGDVGTNSNMEYSGTGSILNLDPDYRMYYYPGTPPAGPQWGSSPPATVLNSLISDPNYRYPSMGSAGTVPPDAPTYDDARTSQYATLSAVERGDEPACAAEIAKVDPAYAFMSTQAATTIYCFNPGIYESGTGGGKNATITLGTGEVGLLKPGAYYLKSGMDISGRLLGGYQAGQPGVALMFDERGPGNCSSCVLSGNNALTLALNAGGNFPPSAAFDPAKSPTAAVDWDGVLVETSGPFSPSPAVPLTLLVKKDPDCVVPTVAPFWEPLACNANKNKTLNVAGGGGVALDGVQYAPTDNVEIHGGSAGDGRVGQIISWTLFYSGGTHINQLGPSNVGNGIVRLDAACAGPTEPCNP